jgi:hypothetical protein
MCLRAVIQTRGDRSKGTGAFPTAISHQTKFVSKFVPFVNELSRGAEWICPHTGYSTFQVVDFVYCGKSEAWMYLKYHGAVY